MSLTSRGTVYFDCADEFDQELDEETNTEQINAKLSMSKTDKKEEV